MSEGDKIETLEATQGKNEGETIASLGNKIVFLPDNGRGIKPGQKIRVVLVEITTKKDARGRTMYRSLPAPDVSSESWKDNGDGTATKVSISTNWKGEAREVGVLETKLLGRRENKELMPNRVSKLIFGNDESLSRVELSVFDRFYEEAEKVKDGKLVWERTDAKREELVETASCKIQKILFREDRGDIQTLPFKLQVLYKPGWTAHLKVIITKPDGEEKEDVFMLSWQDLPVWLQSQHEARYPVCACGCSRYDAQNADGYSKCEECRKQEVCARCGKQTTVKNLAGRLVCSGCEAYEKAEQLINACLTVEMRGVIASEAKKLLTGQAMSGADGEAILRNTLDHLEEFARCHSIERWAKYNWYYFCDSGVYGCKLAPAALQILQFLPQASSNGLVEMVAWVVGQTKPDSPRWDYYLQTQIQGEKMDIPDFTDGMLKQVKLADRLRGSESDRIAAVSGYKALVQRLGLDYPGMKEVGYILRDSQQDYAAAVAKIKDIEAQAAHEKEAQEEVGLEEILIQKASQSEADGNKFKSIEDLVANMNGKWRIGGKR